MPTSHDTEGQTGDGGRRGGAMGGGTAPLRLGTLDRWLAALAARQPRGDLEMVAALLAAALAFAAFPIVTVVRGEPGMDYGLWFATARAYLAGGEIYPGDGRAFDFIYPPSAAAMLAGASAFGSIGFVVVLTLLNTAAWVACASLTVWLVTGRARGQHPVLTLLPTLGVVFWIWDTYLLGQPALLLLALVLGAAALLRSGRPALAGALVGTAAAIKAYPALVLPYLVYRRRWKAAAAAAAALVVWLIALPLLLRPPRMVVSDLVTWTRGVALSYGESSIAQRSLRAYSYRNQSIFGVTGRLLRAIPADAEADTEWTVNVARLSFPASNALLATAVAGLLLLFVLALPRGRPQAPLPEALEWGALLLLVAMVSPLSFNYSFAWMLFPLGAAAGAMVEAPPGSPRRRRWAWVLGASLGVQALALPFRRGAQAYGNVFFSALILFVALALELRARRRAA